MEFTKTLRTNINGLLNQTSQSIRQPSRNNRWSDHDQPAFKAAAFFVPHLFSRKDLDRSLAEPKQGRLLNQHSRF